MTFDELLLGELQRALDAKLGVASMILAACAIDFLGSLYAGSEATGTTFKAFASEFLKSYSPRKLSGMRNRLIHNYVVPRDAYVFSVGRERTAEHLARAERQRIIVDILYDDLKRAAAEFFERVERQPSLQKKVLARLATPSLILVEPADVQGSSTGEQ